MKRILVQFMLPEELKTQFRDLAKSKGYTISGYLVKLINDALEQN